MLATSADAHLEGDEQVRGTSCRTYSVGFGAASSLTAWVDRDYIRRIRLDENATSEPGRGQVKLSVTKERTTELWDFGVSLEDLDWTRLPDFRNPLS